MTIDAILKNWLRGMDCAIARSYFLYRVLHSVQMERECTG